MTIQVPTPSAELLSRLETATIEASQNETAAVAAIRERFAPYAKHNGFVRTGWESQSTSNSSWSREAYYTEAAKKVRGLLCSDEFESPTNRGDQNRGKYTGTRLYLTEAGEWLQLTRSGHWSQWQGEGEGWACGTVDWNDPDEDQEDSYGDDNEAGYSGSIDILSDEQVAATYDLDELLKTLGKAMTEMSKKLPERYGKLKARAELAQRIIAALQ